MYIRIDEHLFIEEFMAIRPDNFSVEGLRLLFEYFETLEESIGEMLELDVIATCCDFSESTAQDIANDYSIDISECEDEEEVIAVVENYLDDNSFWLGTTNNGTIVYQNF